MACARRGARGRMRWSCRRSLVRVRVGVRVRVRVGVEVRVRVRAGVRVRVRAKVRV